MKHTPGPWKVSPTSHHAHDYRIDGPDGLMDFDADEARANARLISAAPDLLAVCQRMLREIEFGGTNATAIRCMIEDAKAAIAKAEGGAS